MGRTRRVDVWLLGNGNFPIAKICLPEALSSQSHGAARHSLRSVDQVCDCSGGAQSQPRSGPISSCF
jgi:hypothetical protein